MRLGTDPEDPVVTAAAFIVRPAAGGGEELLAFKFASSPDLPMRVPGGWLEGREDPEDAVGREIYEEAGLEDVPIRRKLGVTRYFKEYTQRYMERHDFLLVAPAGLPDQWEHRVTGKGGDAGEVFIFRWLAGSELEELTEELRTHVTLDHLPGLFEAVDR